jgi:hypothetical protein
VLKRRSGSIAWGRWFGQQEQGGGSGALPEVLSAPASQLRRDTIDVGRGLVRVDSLLKKSLECG